MSKGLWLTAGVARKYAGPNDEPSNGGPWTFVEEDDAGYATIRVAFDLLQEVPAPTAEQQLRATDKDMARVAEDWIAAVAATNPAALQWIKGNRQGGLAKVNARRVLRGEPTL